MNLTLMELILAILLPPLAVFLEAGFSTHFWINVVLTLIGYVPGIIHALWFLSGV